MSLSEEMDSVTGQPITDIGYKEVIITEGKATYTCKSKVKDPADEDAVWQIKRTLVISGARTEGEWANNGSGEYAYKISDRLLYYSAIPFDNDYSVDFDGIDDHISFGDVHQYDRTNPFSVSLWIKPANLAVTGKIYSKNNTSSPYEGPILEHSSSGFLNMAMRGSTGGGAFTFNTALSAGTWYHIVITYDGSSDLNGIRCYIDSVVENTPTSTTIGGTMLSAADFRIGAGNNNWNPYAGNIDEFCIFNKALTPDEVIELYNSGAPADPTLHSAATNLQSYYKMGDGDTYPTIFDNEGSNDGTMTNMASADIKAETP